MRTACFAILLLTVTIAGAQPAPFELAPPLFKYSSAFFKDSMKLEMVFKQEGAKTYYTLDGSEPDTKATLYQTPVWLRQSAQVKSRNFGEAYLASATESISFFKSGIPIQSVQFSPPSPAYPGNGPQTLHDLEGGIQQHGHRNWLGYNTDSVWLDIWLDSQQPVKAPIANGIGIHTLLAEGSWIFAPDSIQVFAGKQSTHEPLVTWRNYPGHPGGMQMLQLPFPATQQGSHWRVLIFPMRHIPAGHPGVGQRGWLFVDEVLVY